MNAALNFSIPYSPLNHSISSAVVQCGRGKGRNPWRIRAFLADRGHSMSEVARVLSLSSAVVRETVRGTRNNGKTLEYLEAMGCPKEFLYGSQAWGGKA